MRRREGAQGRAEAREGGRRRMREGEGAQGMAKADGNAEEKEDKGDESR
jgi:hypothetical protein